MEDEVREVRGSQILAASGDPERARKVRRYDFRRPDKFPLEQIRVFQMIHEETARGLSAAVSTRAGRTVDLELGAVDQMTYIEFMNSVPDSSAFAVVELPPLRGSIMVQVDGTLAQLLVDAACGQAADTLSLAAPTRPLSEMETLVLESVLEGFLPSLHDGWRKLIELAPAIGTIETVPRNAMIVAPTEMIILASLKATIGDEEAFINIACPYITLEPIVPLLSMQSWYSRTLKPDDASALGARASSIAVACEIAIPVDGIPIASLPAILSGEPLPLPAFDRGDAELRVGSVPIARLRLNAGLLEGDSLALDVADGHRPRSDRAGGGIAEAAEVLARIDPAMHELRREVRSLRIAVEQIGQNGDPIAANPFDSAVPDARVAYMDYPLDVALLVSAERPAIVAFLIAPLEPQTAAQVLTELPSDLRDQTVRALTTLTSADLALHGRILTHLRRRIQTKRDSTVVGGPVAAAQILNHVSRGVEKSVMERFMTEDKPLFESIARLMFVFEDFALVDASAIRKVADQAEAHDLALALKGVQKEVVAHILGALDEEYVTAIEEAEAKIGRVRRSDVEAAQRDVIEELRRLEERGEVIVARPDEVVE